MTVQYAINVYCLVQKDCHYQIIGKVRQHGAMSLTARQRVDLLITKEGNQMKFERQETEFRPVFITLETQEDVENLKKLCDRVKNFGGNDFCNQRFAESISDMLATISYRPGQPSEQGDTSGALPEMTLDEITARTTTTARNLHR